MHLLTLVLGQICSFFWERGYFNLCRNITQCFQRMGLLHKWPPYYSDSYWAFPKYSACYNFGPNKNSEFW